LDAEVEADVKIIFAYHAVAVGVVTPNPRDNFGDRNRLMRFRGLGEWSRFFGGDE